MKKNGAILIAIILLLLCSNKLVFGHCNTMYEPEVIANAKKAIELNDVNYVLKLVKPDDEKEIKDAFDLMTKVKVLSPEAKEVSEKYFLETLARVHQSYDRSFPWVLTALFFITSVLFSILYFRKK